MTPEPLGTLRKSDDAWEITFVRTVAHPPEKVWRAITEPEHLAAWFPHEIVGERRAGAPLRFLSSTYDGFDGEMVVFDPPSVIEMLWGVDRLRIELHPEGGGTRLVLIDTFAELGKAARDGAGWHECLVRLGADLRGAPVPDWGEVWTAVHPDYVAAFGPEASAIGPPET